VRAAAAATAHLLARLRVRVSGLEVLLLEDMGREGAPEGASEAEAQGSGASDAPAATLLRLRELEYRDDTPPAAAAAPDASAMPPAASSAVKAVSFEGAELFLGRGAPPLPGAAEGAAGWTRVLGGDGDADAGWGGSLRVTLPSGGVGAAVEAALRPLALHCAPAPLRDACALAAALRAAATTQAAAAAAATAAVAEAEQAAAAAAAEEDRFQTPRYSVARRSFMGSLLYDSGDGEGPGANEAFFDCATTLSASLSLSADAATTPRRPSIDIDASSDDDEADDHWTAAQWQELRASAAAQLLPNTPQTPPAASAAASAAFFAPPATVWALEVRVEGMRVIMASADAGCADAAALHLRCGTLALRAELADGALQRCGARFEGAAILRSAPGDENATAAAEQGALMSLLPPLCAPDAAELDARLVRVMQLLPPPVDALDAPAVELELSRSDAAAGDTAPWALTLALPPADVWWSDTIPALLADALRSWTPGDAPGEASTPAPFAVSLATPQLRLALARRSKDGAAACLALDLRAARPQEGEDEAPPLLSFERHCDGGTTCNVAFDAAELHIASLSGAPLQRLLRATGGGVVRAHAPPRSTLAAAPGVRLRAWGAATVAAATADAAGADVAAGRPRSNAAEGVAAAEAALQASLEAGAALNADVALAALELASSPGAPFARLYDLHSDAEPVPAASAHEPGGDAATQAACSLALNLTASRLGIRLGASAGDGEGGALRARGVSVFHASSLEGAGGTSLTLLSAESLRVDGDDRDAPPLLLAAAPASAPTACLRVTAATRPCASHAGGELKVAAVARHATVVARRGDATCATMRAVLRRITAELAPPAPIGPDGVPLPPPLTSMHVALADMSLLCGPPPGPPGRPAVAAALLAAAFCVRSDAAATALTLRGAAVHLSRAPSGADELPAPPGLLREHPVGDAELGSAEYVRVIRERQMTLTFRSEDTAGAAAPISVTDLDNTELRIDTHRDTYDALWLLYGQLYGGGGAPAAPAAQPDADEPAAATASVHPGVRAAVHRHLYAAAAAAAVRGARREASSDEYELVDEAGPPAAFIEDFFVRLLPECSDADLADDDESELSGDGWVLASGLMSAPVIVEAPQLRRSRDEAPPADASARYYPPGGPPRMRDAHVPSPRGEERSADEAPPGHYPRALSRFHARRLNVVWTLHPGAGFDGCGDRRAAVSGARLSVAGLTVRRDTFPPTAVHAWRLAASAAGVELDDVTPGAPWARVLGPDTAPPAPPREAGAPAMRLLLRAVRPSPASAPALVEHRLHVAALPLRLRLDQHMLRFLSAFFAAAPEDDDQEDAANDDYADDAYDEPPVQEERVEDACPADDADDDDGDGGTFFQAADVRSLRLRVDYRPRAGGAGVGGAVGLLLAVPWGGVALRLPRVQLGGVAGWGALLSAVGGAWGADVAATQAHKFVRGVPVVRPLVAAGAGAAQLLSAPVATLRQERQRRALRGAARGALAVRALLRLRPMPLLLTRVFASQFARTLGAEARAVQRTVAAGGRAALQAAADAASAAAADRAFR
jgi:hypothetical protein